MTEKRVKIVVDARKAKKEVRELDNQVERLDVTANKTTSSFRKLNQVAAAVGTALASAKIIQYADAFTSVQNQIRQTVSSTEELTQRTQDLLEVANRSRAGLQSTAELYTQLTLSTTELGISEQELLRITETINKTFAISGRSAAESAGAIRQLAQGFAAGALRGDEFNSVAEGAPEIMRAIARETGKTIGELREFAAEGGITAELLTRALENASEVIDDKFNNSMATLGQKTQVANNNLTTFIGSSEIVQAVVGATGDAIVFLSENLGTLVKTLTVLGGAIASKYVVSLAAATKANIAHTTAIKENLAFDIKKIKSTQAAAAEEVKLAEARVLSTKQAIAQLEIDRKIEEVRLKNQITSKGRIQSLSRIAEIRRADIAIGKTLTAQEAALAKAKTATEAATNKLTAAQAKYNAATSIGTRVTKGLRNALALLGGPAGLILTAATAFVVFSERAETAEERTARLKEEVSALTDEFKTFTAFELEQEIARATSAIKAQEEQVAKLREQISGGQGLYGRGPSLGIENVEGKIRKLNEEIEKNKIVLAEAEGAFKALGQAAEDSASDAVVKAADSILDLTESLQRQEQQIGKTTGEIFVMNTAFKIADERAKLLASGIKEGSAELIAFDAAAQKAIESARRIGAARDVDRGSGGGGDDAARIAQTSLDAIRQERALTVEMGLELKTRRKIEEAYNDERLDGTRGFFEQQKALIEARRLEEKALAKQDIANERADFKEKLAQVQSDEMLTAEARATVVSEIQAQQYLSEQMHQDRITQIENDAAEARKQIAQDELQAKLMMTQQVLGGISALMDTESRKAFKIGKAAALANAAISGTQSAIDAWEAGMSTGGPWAPAVAAAYTAASLARTGALISQIKSRQFGGGAGQGSAGGGSAPTPSTVGTVNQPQAVQQPQQQNTVEIRGLSRLADELANRDPDEAIPVEFAQRIVMGLDEYNRLSGGGNG